MRILHVINSLITAGAEKLVLDTLPKYREKGLDIDLAVLVDHDYPFLKLLRKSFTGKIFILGKGSVYNPKTILPLSKLMRNYDLVHVHLFPAQYYAVVANKINKNNARLIFTEHSTSNRRIRNKIFNPLEKYIYKQYCKIICITERLQNIIHAHTKMDIERLPLIMNGVDTSIINNATPLLRNKIAKHITRDDKLIVQVSSMHYPKDQRTLIKSLIYLPETFKLILAGDGTKRLELENIVAKLNLDDRVLFLGKRNDVPQLLKSVDYVVLSSHFEGLSLSSIEGMASGKPFIASDVPGLTEIVKDYGLLFPEGNAEKLAQIILELESNPTLYKKVVKRCQIRAKEFDINFMVNQHIELYEKYQN